MIQGENIMRITDFVNKVLSLKKNENGLDTNQIYKYILKQNKINNLYSKNIAVLYSELLNDNRFILKNQKWFLRENLKLNDINHEYNVNTNNISIILDNLTFIDPKIVNNTANNTEILNMRTRKNRRNKEVLELEKRMSDNLGEMNNSDSNSISNDIGFTEEIDWKVVQRQLDENN